MKNKKKIANKKIKIKSITFRPVQEQIQILLGARNKPPYPKTTAAALRVIFRCYAAEPGTAYMEVKLSSIEDAKRLDKSVKAFEKTVLQLKSCLPVLRGAKFSKNKEYAAAITNLEQQVTYLPKELTSIRQELRRIPEFLGTKMRIAEKEAIEEMQSHFRQQLKNEAQAMENCDPAQREGRKKYYRNVELLEGVLPES